MSSSSEESIECDQEEASTSKNNENPSNNSSRSIVWDYFKLCTIGHRKSICNICNIKLKLPTGTTTPMFNHLKSKHPNAWEVCNKRKRKPKAGENSGLKKQRNLGLSVAEKQELDQLLMEMIAIDLRPFSCVEDKGFKRVLKKLAPNYDPPCRTTFSRNLAPILYQKTKEQLKNKLREDMSSGLISLSFTADCWTSKASDSYISLTVHYLTENFIQENITLGMEQLQQRHTGLYLYSTLQEMMDKWDIISDDNCFIFFITDNARNISSAISQGGWKHIYCFAHTLQLALHDARNCTVGLNELLKKLRHIATHFHHSDASRRHFQEAQRLINDREPLQLIQMVETRWNSEYEMLERMLYLRVPLTQVLATSINVDSLSGKEWKTVEQVVKVLKPLYDATIFSSSSKYPTLSMVIPLLKGITIALDEVIVDDSGSDVMVSELVNNIKESLNIRFNDVETDSVYLKSTYPDEKSFF